jgi:hypothetical protein
VYLGLETAQHREYPVKNRKITVASISCGISLLLAAGASADPLAINTTPAPTNQTLLVGSDTLEGVTNLLIADLTAGGAVSQITSYSGLGSSQGQRQLEGNPAAGEPTCTPADSNGSPELNPGCQEISPLSRPMNASICDDEVTSGTNTTAEQLAICVDGIVMMTDNASHGQFAAGACPSGTSDNTPAGGNFYTVNAAYSTSGALRNAGTLPGVGPGGTDYVIGANGLAGWKDVIRLVYTGCRNDQGDCSAVTRTSRCTGGTTNPTRQAVIDRWDFLVNSGAVTGDTAVDCNGATANACASGLRAAYRRDDSSGTTGVFLSLLSLGSNLVGRTSLTSGIPNVITPISETNLFCDGGDNEDWLPGATAAPAKGDPIAKACRPEDDLCNCNGQMGVVRAVRSPLAGTGITPDVNYPLYQCTRGSFALVPWINTALNVCPDGTKPTAGNCKLPYFNDTSTSPATRRFNCINDAGSRPISASSCDGRAYNFVMRNDAGTVRFRSGNLPQGALMRHNVRVLDTVLPVPGGLWPANTQVCEQADATRQIGCLTANTTCTIGWAGREGAALNPYDNTQEPFSINGFSPSDTNLTTVGAYPFARDLYIAAIGGFENITADCQARNGGASSQFCADQVAFAQAFYDMTPDAMAACAESGYIPKATSECVGAQIASGVTCGKPAAQAKSECDPQ